MEMSLHLGIVPEASLCTDCLPRQAGHPTRLALKPIQQWAVFSNGYEIWLLPGYSMSVNSGVFKQVYVVG